MRTELGDEIIPLLSELPAAMGDSGGSDVFVTDRHDQLVQVVEDLKKEVDDLRHVVAIQDRVVQTTDRAIRMYNSRVDDAQAGLRTRRTNLRKHMRWFKWAAAFCFILTIVLGVLISHAELKPATRDLYGILELRALIVGVVLAVLSKIWFKLWDRPDFIRL